MDADEEALKRFLDGDERAFEELVSRYEARVRCLAFGILGNRELSEDVAQEAFITAYRKAKSFRGRGAFRSWLFRIAINRARDERRRQGRRLEVALEVVEEAGSEPHHGLEAGWTLARVLANLRPEYRAAILLREVEGLSYRQIADTLGWPIGTVETRIHRARIELRDALTERARDKEK
jgi:RNA polymerase sigma-70 factor (ECF subfamily)